MTERARQTFRDSFLTGHGCKVCPRIDIDPALPLHERQRMADAMWQLHWTRCSHRAAIARARAAGFTERAEQYERELEALSGAGAESL